MKAPSPAQLAARKRFAEMARSGAFKKKATKRKANPEPTHDFAKIGKPFSWDGRTWKVSQYAHTGKTIEAFTTDRKSPYRRETLDVAMLMGPRRKTNPADIHLAGNYYGKVSKDGTGSFWTYVVNRVKEVNPDGSLYETDDVVGDFKAKHYATMKGAINALDKYKTKLSGVKRNPAKNLGTMVRKTNPMHKYTVLHRGTANVAGQVTASGPQAAKQKVAEKLGIPTLAYLVAKKTNPAKKTVSQKISQLVHEGYPQRQAVAVALSEQRAGKVKRNPMMTPSQLAKVKKELQETERLLAQEIMGHSVQNQDEQLIDFYHKHIAKLKRGLSTGKLESVMKTPIIKQNPAKVKYRNLATDLKGDQRVGYSVHLASQPGHNAIAWFSKKADAVKVAQEAADRTGKDLAVSRVQNYFGAM